MKDKTLLAKVCLLPESAAIAPKTGCVAVPLSEKVLELNEPCCSYN
jgi:hypothetical protein